jgi:hypothetical protein
MTVMPITNALAAAGILRAEEIAMLSQVYDELSAEPSFTADMAAREALATHILRRYETGTTDPVALKAACMENAKFHKL